MNWTVCWIRSTVSSPRKSILIRPSASHSWYDHWVVTFPSLLSTISGIVSVNGLFEMITPQACTPVPCTLFAIDLAPIMIGNHSDPEVAARKSAASS